MKNRSKPSWTVRAVLLRILGWSHCSLIVAVCCGAVFSFLRTGDVYKVFTSQFDSLASLTVWTAYLRGLLFCVPVALSYAAIRKAARLWQFFLLSLLITGLSWLLLGHPLGAVLGALCCFFRARKRLAEETDISALDAPSWLGLIPFPLAFLFSAVLGDPLLQRLSAISCALYFLDLLAYGGVRRIAEYLELNREMRGLPVRRIQRTAGIALGAAVLLAGLLLIPAVWQLPGDFHIDPYADPSPSHGAELEAAAQELAQSSSVQMPQGQIGFGFQIPAFVSYLLYAVSVGGVGLLLLYGAYRIVKALRSSFTDSRDVVRFLSGDDPEEEAQRPLPKDRKPALWDRSPNAQVRRRYRKAVLKAAPEPPHKWMAPAEIEQSAGLSAPELHRLYEKARYSPVPCTPEDLRSMKEKA